MEETHVLAMVADGKTAASWEEGKRNCKTHPESAFGWVLIGWVLGRSLKIVAPIALFPKNLSRFS